MLLLLATAMAGTLTLSDTVWFAEEELVLERPGHRVAMPSGFLFGVEADGQPVGVVFVGNGEAHTEVGPDDAMRLGNQLVLGGEAPLERMRDVVDRGVFEEPVDTVLVLGLDAPSVTDGLREVEVDGGVVGTTDDHGVFQVVVTDQRLGASRRKASQRLHDRQESLAELGLDPHDAVRMDRWEDRDRWVVDARGSTHFHPAIPSAVDGRGSRWTTWIEDPTGAVAEGHKAVWLAHGRVPGATWDTEDVALTARLAGQLAEPEGAQLRRLKANVAGRPHHSGLHADLSVESLASYEVDDRTRLLHLHVPCHEVETRYAQMHVQRSCGLDRATFDGLDLTYVGRGFGVRSRGNEGGVYLLPRRVTGAEEVVLRVVHHDRLALGVTVFGAEEAMRRERRNSGLAPAVGGLPGLLPLGATSEAADVLPFAKRTNEPVRVELRAGLPEGRYQLSISGEVDHALEKGRDTWAVVEQPGRPHVVIGDFDGEESFGGQRGMPAVRVLARDPYVDADLHVLARATTHFFLDALPPFPHGELEIVQGASSLSWEFGEERLPRPQVESAPGQLLVKGVHAAGNAGRILRSRWPHNLEVEMAEGVAAQWWQPVDRPYALDDAWIGRAMPRLYAELFLDHAYKDKVLRMWREIPRDGDGDHDPAERQAQRIAGLFHGLVRARVGEEGLLRGLYAFLRRDGRTTAELQLALEQVTGEDLADVFDLWLHTELRPELTASWQLDGEALLVQLHSDLPFGAFRVPIELHTRRGSAVHWVEVADGVGRAHLPLDGRLVEVRVDPQGLVPLERIHVDECSFGRAFAMSGAR